MKTFLKSKWVISLLLLIMSASGMACEISLSVDDKNKKDAYKENDELVVLVKLEVVHRDCHVPIDEAKMASAGCKIVGTTKWVERKPGTFERKLKVKITSGADKDILISCKRDCRKEGGYGKLVLKRND